MSALIALGALLLLALGIAVAQRVFTVRLRTASDEPLRPADLGTATPFGARATLVQFSVPDCETCPGTAAVLRTIAGQHDGVVHVEVDLAAQPELEDRFRVLQTPTTLLVDAEHRVRARIGGALHPDTMRDELAAVLGGDRSADGGSAA